MNEHIDMKISGSSTMPGGEYGSVSISGAGKVNGSLKCEELHCSGAAKVQGDVDCARALLTGRRLLSSQQLTRTSRSWKWKKLPRPATLS